MSMKTRIFIALLFVLINTACEKGTWPNCIKANNTIAKETRTLEPFTTVEFNMSGELIITQDSTLSGSQITLEMSENIIEAIQTDVRNNVLTIKDDRCLKNLKNMTFHLSVADIRTLVLNGTGNIRTAGTLNSESLSLEVNGSGNVAVDINASYLKLTVNGSGNFDLSGSATELDCDINGSGNIMAFGLSAGLCNILVNGSGNTEVSVSGDLNVEINGSGNVVYGGQPTAINVNTSGSGSVKAR